MYVLRDTTYLFSVSYSMWVVLMVIFRAFSSGDRSISSYVNDSDQPFSLSTFVIACVKVVFPWSTWPIVPMFTWGLLRSKSTCAAKPRHAVKRTRLVTLLFFVMSLMMLIPAPLVVPTDDPPRDRRNDFAVIDTAVRVNIWVGSKRGWFRGRGFVLPLAK